MKSISMKLINIHSSFNVKFKTIIEKDLLPNQMQNYSQEMIESQKKICNSFTSGDNTYFVLNNSSFVVIDIATKNDKKDYSSNYNISLNRRNLYRFVNRLERIYRVFTEEERLFFYDNNVLYVNKDISSKYIDEFSVTTDKVVRFEIVSINFEDTYYEGIYISINSMNYYSYLTYDQIALLLDVLKSIDFFSIELQLINTYLHFKDMKSSEISKKEPKVEVSYEEIIDTKKKVKIEEPHEILDEVKLN